MITKTLKTEYKLKAVSSLNGNLVDENGEIINVQKDLVKLFNGKEFSLTATLQQKDEYQMSDIAE